MNPSKYGRPDQESWLSDRVWFVVLSGKRLWNLFHPTSCGDLRPKPPIKCTIAPSVFPRINLHSNPYHLANSMKGPLVTNMPRKNKLVRVPCHFQSEHAYTHPCMYIYIYSFMYICIFVYMYMYIYIDICITLLHTNDFFRKSLLMRVHRLWIIHKSFERSKARPALVFPGHGKQPSPVKTTKQQQFIQQTASPNSFRWEIYAFLVLPFWLSVTNCFNRVKRMLMDVGCLHASHCTGSNQDSEYLHIFLHV